MEPINDPWSERLEQYLKQHGMRLTKQRRIIAGAFFDSDGHPNVEQIYDSVKQNHPGIGQATVYRTLKLLQESGLANASRFGGDTTRFEAHHDDEHHDHLICVRCGHITEFFSADMERIQDEIAAKFGFRLTDHKHELYGVPLKGDPKSACDHAAPSADDLR